MLRQTCIDKIAGCGEFSCLPMFKIFRYAAFYYVHSSLDHMYRENTQYDIGCVCVHMRVHARVCVYCVYVCTVCVCVLCVCVLLRI